MSSPNHHQSQNVRLRIEGMTCGSCVDRVERALTAVAQVRTVCVNLATETAVVETLDPPPARELLFDAVRGAGYNADTVRSASDLVGALDRTQLATLQRHKQALGQAIALGLPIACLHWLGPFFHSSEPGGHVWPIALQAILSLLLLASSAGAPILVGGLRALLHRSPNMELLITLGVTVAFVAGLVALFGATQSPTHFHAVALIIGFVNLGRYFEARARRSASRALCDLAAWMPRKALLVTDHDVREVAVDRLQTGDRVRVAQDAVVPVDGRIVEGEAAVDESNLTGEPLPQARRVGDPLTAGSVVRDGLVTVEATRVGAQTSVGQILQAVENAQSGKTRMQRIADRVAGVFVPLVTMLSILVLLVGHWTFGLGWLEAVERSVAVLVIACPCAMGLATPMAVLVASGAAAQLGILIRNVSSLEALARVDTILLDKTGTLTTGKPEVTTVTVVPDARVEMTDEVVLGLAASAERYAQHPIARAIVHQAEQQGITLVDPSTFTNEPGRGVEATVEGSVVRVGCRSFLTAHRMDLTHTRELARESAQRGRLAVFVAVEQRCVGVIEIADRLRPEASDMVETLQHLGISTALLSGDHAETTEAVARQVGISQALSELKPEDKQSEVRRRVAAGQCVAFVGDGINDAPALAQADVGVTFAAASDIAVISADITIVHNDLRRLPAIIKLAKRSVGIIKQNLFWAFFYNGIALPLAATGKIPPGYAALAMMASSLSVVLNSLRLKRC